jgi:hypothetical protein
MNNSALHGAPFKHWPVIVARPGTYVNLAICNLDTYEYHGLLVFDPKLDYPSTEQCGLISPMETCYTSFLVTQSGNLSMVDPLLSSVNMYTQSGLVVVIGTPSSQRPILYNPHPCGLVSSDSVGSFILQLESNGSVLTGSRVCIHPILTNTGPTPINLTDYVMNVSVTDPSGKQVFSNYFVVGKPNATLFTGNSWDGLTYWNSATASISPGVYKISASIFSYTTNRVVISTSATLNLSQA